MPLQPDEAYCIAGNTQRVINLLVEFRDEMVAFAAGVDPLTVVDVGKLREADKALAEVRKALIAEAQD